MKKIKLLLSLSHKFCLKYTREYFKMLLKPCFIGILGFIFVPLSFVNPIFGFGALFITLPCLFYSFWRGFCVTYLLNYAALSFVKQETGLELKAYENAFKPQEKDFAKYVSFCALIILICHLPYIFHFVKSNLELVQKAAATSVSPVGFFELYLCGFIISMILAPFTNYFTQSYFFKKDSENYFKLFFNCFKNLNKEGVLIAFIITIITFIVSSLNILLLPLLLVLNLYSYSINTFWYYSKCSKENSLSS